MSTVVVYMGLRHLGAIAAKLAAAGMPADTPAAVVAHATLPTQRIYDGELATIADQAEDAPTPAVAVVGACVRHRDRLTALARAHAGGDR